MRPIKKCLDCDALCTRQRCRKCYDINRTTSRVWHNKQWLQEQYDKGLSFDSIAELAGCGHTIIAYWFKKFGLKPRPAPSKGVCRRELNYSWKGGKWKASRGYVYIHTDEPHEYKTRRYYVAEHILEAEKALGRRLIKPETVHHKNGIKDDNRPENLQVMADESAHHKLETSLALFAKQIAFGDLCPELKPQIRDLLNIFLSKNE